MSKKDKSKASNKNWQLVNFCEFDKYAIKSYCAIHNVDESLNLGDITKVDETKLDDFNMMTWGFPCTSISTAGKRQGFFDENGNRTASGLYYEGIRILKYNKPAVSIIENVKNLTGKKFKNEFETVLNDLEEAGYTSYWKVLNAKDYGVPQNRERVYIVSIRKDLDNGKFKFPEPFDSEVRLKDILETEVDDSFYISSDRVKQFVTNTNSKNSTLNQVAQIYPNSGNPQAGRIYDANGISPAMDTCQGGNRMPKVLENITDKTQDQKYIDNISSEYDFVKKRTQEMLDKNNKLPDMFNPYNKSEITNYAPTITTACNASSSSGTVLMKEDNFRIRKLTPKECFRLMGFSDEDFNAAQNIGTSNSQMYKQAGNSIVVDVLHYIYRELYIAMPYLFDDLKVLSLFSGIGAFECGLDRLYKDINSGNFIKSQME